MITLKDIFTMTSDDQKIIIDFDDTIEYTRVYSGNNPAYLLQQELIGLSNKYIANAENYPVAVMYAKQDNLHIVIMNKEDYEREVKEYEILHSR